MDRSYCKRRMTVDEDRMATKSIGGYISMSFIDMSANRNRARVNLFWNNVRDGLIDFIFLYGDPGRARV